MNAKRKSVDVLALIDREIEVLRGSCANDPDPDDLVAEAMADLQAARSRVAELLIAAEACAKDCVWSEDVNRLVAAIAACRGEA